MMHKKRLLSIILTTALVVTLCFPSATAFAISKEDKTDPSWKNELFSSYVPNEQTHLCNLRTEYMETPLGIDAEAPVFSWEMDSDVTGQKQTAYQILVSTDENFPENKIVWDSGVVTSDNSMGIRYAGTALNPQTRYFWKAAAKDKDGKTVASSVTWFETGLMCTDQSNWPAGIQWVGNPNTTANNSGAYNQNAINNFTTEFRFSLANAETKKFRAIVAARNKVTYAFAEIDLTGEPTLRLGEVTEGNSVTTQAWPISSIPDTTEGKNGTYTCSVLVNGRAMSATIGTFATGNQANFLSATPGTSPRRWYMGNFGFNVTGGDLILESFRQYNGTTTYYTDNFSDPNSQLATMGTVADGKLTIHDTYALRRAIQTTTLRKEFSVKTDKEIKSARMYVTGRGIYDAYINGKPVTDTWFNPNFTEYEMRIMYQTFDVTDLLRAGNNAIGAYVSRGWYADYNGYSGSQRAGAAGDMMAFIKVDYTDGESEVVTKTDNTWKFNAASPSINGSFLDGEIYDATLETPGWNQPNFDDSKWSSAGVKNAPNYTARIAFVNNNSNTTSSYYWNLNPTFKLSAQVGPLSKVERVLPALNLTSPKINNPGDTNFNAGGNQQPSGLSAYTYDLGQNIVGVPKVTVKGARGTEIEITGAEIAFKDGTPYSDNYRSAYNTTSYTLKGDAAGETFSPKFTYNGFRYITIRVADGNPSDIEIQNVEGIVLTNTDIATGDLNTSDGLINQLQSNALWGQRGNYLMVPTDCPQRNERMGWTADTQVFSTTASYNVDTIAFLKKWLIDVRDAQVRYNRGGAVPDTAPLGGDNRGSQYGCSIWADAGVMIPWNLYIATGDIGFLADNYDLMWDMTKYRAGRNTGHTDSITNINGGTVGNADAWLVAQQRRGDHLAYDATTPFVLSGTAYAYYVCDLMNRTAVLLNKTADATNAATWAGCFKKGFNDKYVFSDGSIHYMGETATGAYTMNMWHAKWGLTAPTSAANQTPPGQSTATYVDFHGNYVRYTEYGEPEHNLTRVAIPAAANGIAPPSETSYALAIAFGLLPEDKMEAAGEYLVKSVQRRASETQPNGALSVGFASVAWILPALSMTGHDDVAYDLLMEEGLPGWLYTVLQGGTTFWERWNSYTAETDTMGPVDMNSFNHYAYGAVGYWMYGYMMGLQLDEKKPGYKHVNIAPVAGGDMTYATTYHDSIFGRVESGWKAKDNEITDYSTVVPANTTATLYLPVKNAAAAGGPSNDIVVPGVSYKGADEFNGRPVARYELESGHYTFYRLDTLQNLYEQCKDLKESDYTTLSWSPLAPWVAEINSAVQLGLPYAPATFTAEEFTAKLNTLVRRANASMLTVLQIIIDQYVADFPEANYTPGSWKPLGDALDDARAIIATPGDFIDDDAYAVMDALIAAENGLVRVADKSGLKMAIDYAENMLKPANIGKYIPVSVGNLQNALTSASAVYADAEATQPEVTKANQDLLKAIGQMYEKGDKAGLQAIVSLVSRYVQTSYTPASWATFAKALEDAQKVIANPNAIADSVNKAYTALTAATAGLTRRADFTALNASIVIAQQIVDNIGDYTPSTVVGLAEELGVAKVVAGNFNSTQAQVNAAAAALGAKILAARLKPDLSGLLSATTRAKAVEENLYTAASYKALTTAVTEAEAVLRTPDKVTQADVDGATQAVQSAITALVPKPVATATGDNGKNAAKTVIPKVKVSKITTSAKAKLVVKWAKAPSTAKVTGYQVQYRVKGSAKWITRVVSAKSASTTIKSLKKNKKYQIRIRAYRTDSAVTNYGPWSAVKVSKKIR